MEKSVTCKTAELPFKKGGIKFRALAISCKTPISSLCSLILKKNLKFLFFISIIEKQPSASVKSTNHSNHSFLILFNLVLKTKELINTVCKVLSIRIHKDSKFINVSIYLTK